MVCDKEIQRLINLDFSQVDDSSNWFTNSTSNITTVGGKMKLKAQDGKTFFKRNIGSLEVSKNRIRVKSNLEFFRPQTSSDSVFCALFAVFAGTQKIDEFTIYKDELSSGERVSYYFDRIYKYKDITGQINLTINIPEGFENVLFMKDLIVDNQIYCSDDIRTYFALKDVFLSSFNAQSVGLKLKEFKIDGVETLTSSFFNETSNDVGGNSDGWLFAKADLSGVNRVSEIPGPNTNNIFERDCKLVFDTVSSFHGGKPTGTITGSNYGNGILSIGYDKPEVLNKNLVTQKGAFFIDIDYTKDLKVVFDVIINRNKTSLYDSPSIYRTYFIEVDSEKCTRKFYYKDNLKNGLKIIDDINGFLTGINEGNSSFELVGCGEVLSYSGKGGTTDFKFDLGSSIGDAGIDFTTIEVPAKFVIEWNGQTISTGYVGPSFFDQELLNSGINQDEIKTLSPSNGTGQLRFNKNLSTPSIANVSVFSPLENTSWEIKTVCPSLVENNYPSAIIGLGTCSKDPDSDINVFINTTDISTYFIANGDVIYSDSQLSSVFIGGGNSYKIKVSNGANWNENEFKVSNLGVVSDLNSCTQNAEDISIISKSLGGCQTIWEVSVRVPDGESRIVNFDYTSQGMPAYARYDNINNRDVSLSSDSDFTITKNTNFIFGIEGSLGVNDFINSVIILTLKTNLGIEISEKTYSRTHSGIPCRVGF